MKVLLGPAHELHVGVHGSLLAAPPPDITYVGASYLLRFRPDRETGRPFSPLHDPAIEEWVRFVDAPADVAVVHSSRLPVQSRLPWIVDADSLMTPLQVGRFYALGAAARNEPPTPDPRAVVRRQIAMTARYASRRCVRILFRTERARRTFLDHLIGHGERPEVVEKLAAKSEVVFPAVPAMPLQARCIGRTPGVLYMGRTARDKGAAIAAEVFARLRTRYRDAVQLVFLGSCPDPLVTHLRAIGVAVLPMLPRSDYLDKLREADIFLSPTTFESFGMGLVEAAAAGLAVVCSAGPGMEHVGELLTSDENALFVPNTGLTTDRVAGFTAAVSTLLDDEPLRFRLQTSNHALASRGRLSVRARDERLGAAYSAAAALGADLTADTPGMTVEEPQRLTDWAEDVCFWADRRCSAQLGGRVIA